MERKTRSIVLISLALLSTFTIVGSGFALWNFSNDEGASTESMVNINVENYIEMGEVKITSCPDKFYIESDNDQYSNYGGIVFYNTGVKYDEGQLESEFNFVITFKDGYDGITLKKEMIDAKLTFDISKIEEKFEIYEKSPSLNKDEGSYDQSTQTFTFGLTELYSESGKIIGFTVSEGSFLNLNGCFRYKPHTDHTNSYQEVLDLFSKYIGESLINLTLTVSFKENWEDYI